MPRRLRILIYSVLLTLALYMYWVSGQQLVSEQAPVKTGAVLIDPLNPSGSLNVKRGALTSVYEKVPFNLKFDYFPLADGRSRVVGRSKDGSTVIELVGPPEGVTSINLMASLSDAHPLIRLKNLNAISLLIEVTLADWAGAPAWVVSNIDEAFAGNGATTSANGKAISISVAPQTQTLVVTIIGPPL